MIKIRAVQERDEQAWKALWRAYNEFQKADIPARITNRTWARINDRDSSLFCRVAVDAGGAVVGFANAVLHEGTWVTRPICYLEDLFVAPDARRGGVATALIEDLLRLATIRRWSRLYWHTEESNTTARRVYDRFVAADGTVRYRMMLGS